MEKHYLALDYDNVTPKFITNELLRLKDKYRIVFTLHQSSKNSYHIRSKKPIGESLAFDIMDNSKCSEAYKLLCHRIKKFPIRNSEKVFTSDKLTETKPKPKLLAIL